MTMRLLVCAMLLASCGGGGQTRKAGPPDAKAICQITQPPGDAVMLRSEDRNAITRAKALHEATTDAAARVELDRFLSAAEVTEALVSARERRANKIVTLAGYIREALAGLAQPSLTTAPAGFARVRALPDWANAIEPFSAGRVQALLEGADRSTATAVAEIVKIAGSDDGSPAARARVTEAIARLVFEEGRRDQASTVVRTALSAAITVAEPDAEMDAYLTIWANALTLASLAAEAWPDGALAVRHTAFQLPDATWVVTCVNRVPLALRPAHAALAGPATGARDALTTLFGLGPARATTTPAPELATLRERLAEATR